MMRAPRPLMRRWPRLARGGLLAAALWLPLAVAVEAQQIVGAAFGGPTTRYAHGVLGDAVEWGTLTLQLSDGRTRQITLPEDRVFEDLEPRLWDLDLDGHPEVVVVESQAQTGAQLAVYGPKGTKIAATPHIGTRNRWLAPVAAADLDGDGRVEIAYVDRPHLAKTLRIWRFEEGALREVAALQSVSNHRIGWAYIVGGVRDCGSGPELVVASGNWSDVVVARFKDGQVSARPVSPYSDAALDRAMTCR